MQFSPPSCYSLVDMITIIYLLPELDNQRPITRSVQIQNNDHETSATTKHEPKKKTTNKETAK
jgi:hypothetical protein